jgi:hypothetical protein
MILRALAISAVVFTAPSSAALFTFTDANSTWTEVTTNNDLRSSNDTYLPWRDITKFWYASDGTRAYFQIDLAGGPGADGVTANDTLLYAVYIDSDGNASTGGQGDEWGYLYWDETYANGIESIIDAHYDTNGGQTLRHTHFYTGAGLNGYNTFDYAAYDIEYDFNYTDHLIQWSAPLAEFGITNSSVFYATSYDIDDPTESYDLARLNVPAEVPLPPTWLILVPGLALVRLIGRVR